MWGVYPPRFIESFCSKSTGSLQERWSCPHWYSVALCHLLGKHHTPRAAQLHPWRSYATSSATKTQPARTRCRAMRTKRLWFKTEVHTVYRMSRLHNATNINSIEFIWIWHEHLSCQQPECWDLDTRHCLDVWIIGDLMENCTGKNSLLSSLIAGVFPDKTAILSWRDVNAKNIKSNEPQNWYEHPTNV